jgi:lipopolysaccharide transport system ATP-binding protein
MANTAITVEQLSKMYQLGGASHAHDTLRDALVSRLRWPRPSATRQPNSTLWALKDVSFEVPRGQVVGIVGRNGAGKSTLLKILTRITEPTSGYADVTGRVGSLLEVGTGFHPELTGRENIYLNGAILGMSRSEIQRRFEEIGAFAEIERFIDTPVKRYSSGMYVRLAFSVAAHLEPEVLLVDEVLAVGDAEFQRRCLGRMGAVAQEGRTVVFISHNMAAVVGLCTRAILVSGGSVVADGSPDAVVDKYRQSTQVHATTDGPLARSPDGAVELLSVECRSDAGQTVIPAAGQDVAFELLVRSHERIGQLKASIGIENAYGVRVSLLSTHLVGQTLSLEAPSTTLVCRVPRLPLVPGVYTLSVKLTGPQGVLIWAPDAVSLNVESGDFFRSGQMLQESWMGSTLITHSWNER